MPLRNSNGFLTRVCLFLFPNFCNAIAELRPVSTWTELFVTVHGVRQRRTLRASDEVSTRGRTPTTDDMR